MKKRWNYIVAIISFILAIIMTIAPNLLTNLINKLNWINIILIFTSIIFIFYKKIITILIKVYSRLSVKIVLSFICIILVILKMFDSKLEIDNNSIYLIIISILVVIIPDLNQVIERVSKVKTGDLELEFNIKNLSEGINKVEEVVDKNNKKIKYEEIDKETLDRFDAVESDPKLLIVAIGIEVEARLRKIVYETYGDKYTKASMEKMLIDIGRTGILNNKQIEIYREFRRIRNKIAHGVDMKDISDEKLYECAELGIRILNTIPTKIEK